jgi:RNA polymerase sigma factor (sigma-70 family)
VDKAAPKPSDDGPRRGESVDRLIAEHLPGLTAFVRLRLGPLLRAHESCADIVQSACREVLAHAGRFQFGGEGRFRQWLYTTALRKITDRKRYYLASKRRVDRNAGGVDLTASDARLAECYQTAFTSPSAAAMKHEDIERLERAFDRLSDEDREVVTLARIANVPHAEIAEAIGITVGAVRVRLSRALVRLAALMKI